MNTTIIYPMSISLRRRSYSMLANFKMVFRLSILSITSLYDVESLRLFDRKSIIRPSTTSKLDALTETSDCDFLSDLMMISGLTPPWHKGTNCCDIVLSNGKKVICDADNSKLHGPILEL